MDVFLKQTVLGQFDKVRSQGPVSVARHVTRVMPASFWLLFQNEARARAVRRRHSSFSVDRFLVGLSVLPPSDGSRRRASCSSGQPEGGAAQWGPRLKMMNGEQGEDESNKWER